MKTIPIIILLLATTLCCTTYTKMSEGEDHRFEVKKVEDNQYYVVYYGSKTETMSRARDFALLRAAELGKSLGFTHLAVAKDASTSIQDTFESHSRNGTAFESATVEPAAMLGIIYYKERPEDVSVQNIEDIIRSLFKKYRIKP